MPPTDELYSDRHHCKKLVFRFPLIAKEWHPTKNATPTAGDISYGSNDKVWWQCSKNPDHEWKAVIANRSKGSGCPECVREKPKKD